MSSSASSGVSDGFRRLGDDKSRGLPRKCRCGASSTIRTSETLKNPGRLFHCCPYGSKEDNKHLFKWTDIAMVEEMEEVENVVKKIKVDVRSLQKILHDVESETRTCEAVTNSYGTEIESISAIAKGCDKEIGELKAMVSSCEKEIQRLRSFKNLIICFLVMYLAWLMF